MVFYTGSSTTALAGSERMRIDSSGNVGIGTSSPSFESGTGGGLEINNSSGNGAHVKLTDAASGSGGTNGFDLYAFNTSGYIENYEAGSIVFRNGGSERARIDASGNLLVGTTSGSDKVTVNGDVSATNFNTTSDATLKTNVETLSGSLDAVMSMRGVSFDWIESGKSEVGVIAQEVEEVIPDLVNTNEQGIKSVKYGNMVAVLIEAIKDQQKRIEALEAQLNS